MRRPACLFLPALGLCVGLCAQSTPSFRNDVIPAMTKLGCNAGQCHGSQYGKGGFKLSLLGFDVEADYDAIVKDVKGRRVNLASLAEPIAQADILGMTSTSQWSTRPDVLSTRRKRERELTATMSIRASSWLHG